MPLDFAKPKLVDVLAATQPGQKGQLGVSVKAHFFIENSEINLGLEIENQTGASLSDFDIKINTNPFAIFVSG